MSQIGDLKLVREGQDALNQPRWCEYWYLSQGGEWTPTWHSQQSVQLILRTYQRVEAFGNDGIAGIYIRTSNT